MAAGTPNNDDPGASAGQGEREEKATTTLDLLLARLQALRTARGLTQEAFAEAAGFSYKYYQAVEAGRKTRPAPVHPGAAGPCPPPGGVAAARTDRRR